MPPWNVILGAVLFAMGAAIVVINFWLEFIRYPLHRFHGGDRNTFRHISVVPVVGQILLLFACQALDAHPRVTQAGIMLILLDFGGLHIALIVLAYDKILSLFKGRSEGA